MPKVFVLNKDRVPLMPTDRCGHVSILLKEGKARVVQSKPFTIQLLYETEEPCYQPLVLGIDPGRTNIGLAVIDKEAEPVILVHAETRNKDIPKLMSDRKSYRQHHRRDGRRCVRQRRANRNSTETSNQDNLIRRRIPGCKKDIICHGIKNKKVRFNNRKREAGWLTPTATQLLRTHINLIKKIIAFVPVSDVVLEINKFAFMELDNPNIRKWEYQKGQLFGYASVHDAVSEQQKHHCIFCENKIAHYHHIVPRSEGGSDTLPNMTGLCNKHHDLVHKSTEWFVKMKSKKEGLNKKYGALSVLNQIIPSLTRELSDLYPGHTYVTDGRSTKAFRCQYGLDKEHAIDAYCIAASILDIPLEKEIDLSSHEIREIKQYRRHDRQACNQENVDRKYVDKDGKVVCKNRHKRMEQKDDSLEEFRSNHSQKEVTSLRLEEHKPTYKRLDRVMPGAIVLYQETKKDVVTKKPIVTKQIIFVMNSSKGFHNGRPDYYKDIHGTKYLYTKCRVLQNNTGLVFV